MLYEIITRVAIKKGNKAGTTELAQSNSPFFVADKLSLEKITRQTVNNIKIIDKKYFFIEKVIKRNFI